jgi:hypothetical protein
MRITLSAMVASFRGSLGYGILKIKSWIFQIKAVFSRRGIVFENSGREDNVCIKGGLAVTYGIEGHQPPHLSFLVHRRTWPQFEL